MPPATGEPQPRTLWYGADGALLRVDFVNRGYPITLIQVGWGGEPAQ